MGLSLTEDIKSVSEFKKQIRQVFVDVEEQITVRYTHHGSIAALEERSDAPSP